MKNLRLIAGALGLALLAAGCTGTPDSEVQSPSPAPTALLYTNLSDESTRQELGELLTEAEVPAARQEAFWYHVDELNTLLSPKQLTQGYEPLGELKYDPYEVQDCWSEAHPDFYGYNCRITAFTLFGNRISASAAEVPAPNLMFDLDSLKADPSAFPGEEDTFTAFYAAVPTTGSQAVEDHVQQIRKVWADRGISFSPSSKISLISMVFHDTVDEANPNLFIGHTGVLLTADDGLYFVEKLTFQEPYQVVKLHDRSELNAYLMGKYDVEYGQPTAAPFILENDWLMEGYTRLHN